MPEAKHIINKVFLEVNTSSNKVAFDLKDNIGVFLKHQVFPIIEGYFEKQSDAFPETVFRFNKISIDVNQTDLDNLHNLKNQIVNTLKKKMDTIFQRATIGKDEGKLVVVTHSKSALQAFIYFLKTGLKPWWKPDLMQVLHLKSLKEISSEKSFNSEFTKALAYKKARQRLINQFDDDVLSLLLATPKSKKVVVKQKAFTILEKNTILRYKFWSTIIEYYRLKKVNVVKTELYQLASTEKSMDASDYKILETYVASLIGEPLKDVKIIQQATEKIDDKIEAKEAIVNDTIRQEEGLFVNNAGLVLLHPFLKQLFSNAKLVDSNGKIIESEIETAIHLLHYIVTKEEQQVESELVLEKFLCGYPIDQPMQRFVVLSEDLKQLAEDVLQAAITHWTALKNTSPDGLRTGFLQREGKLIIENGTGRLIIERKGQDILLDKIPWNISLVKLPWLDKIVFVEW